VNNIKENKSCLPLDSCTIISLSMNCLMPIIEKFAEQEKTFYVSPAVFNEIYSHPLNSKRFLWPALKVKKYFEKGYISIMEYPNLEKDSQKILFWANKIYSTKKGKIHLIHKGEAETIALTKYLNLNTIATDEYITRLILEEPITLKKHFERKLHMPVTIDKKSLEEFQKIVGDLKVVRSAELAALAFEQGFFDEEINLLKNSVENVKELMIKGIMWGLKFSGCSIIISEINDYVALLSGNIEKIT